MKVEIERATRFLRQLYTSELEICPASDAFLDTVQDELSRRYKGHWYADSPSRGQAFRCLHHEPRKPCVVVRSALEAANTPPSSANDTAATPRAATPVDPSGLVSEWTIWVDPRAVSVRLGAEAPVYMLNLNGASQQEDDARDQLLIKESLSRQASATSSAANSPVLSANLSPDMPPAVLATMGSPSHLHHAHPNMAAYNPYASSAAHEGPYRHPQYQQSQQYYASQRFNASPMRTRRSKALTITAPSAGNNTPAFPPAITA
ncbi:uncharacterized protein MONBRDRAFT_24793 [Monosiga brevicollis MX1]|uniref:Anti-proliferative protein domain-containing protein n=1 Tax=Monosiga brevicollis TaxID=81824 RepID=A9UXR3_MONBE|nr:uncharacterized protein MONBRDRAFT_24793 [Monosiga brevicollis MX1]EDQ89889.1 predicted protein [Monosiga brevicollis MX1]|eukprot:XP_001745311.1 hypothetical protein [Monosiga brevicollis MX1]